MKEREVLKTVEPEITSDGAGVTLKRLIANRVLSDLDPFLLLDHFGSDNPDDYIAGFPMHPHRGIETVTYMLKGVIKHRDSSGNEGVITTGGVQWMTAGGGIMHEEMPEVREGGMEGFQLWVNLPAKRKMMDPRYQEFSAESIPTVEMDSGASVKVIAGEVRGVKGVVTDIEANPTYIDVTLPADCDFEHEVPAGHAAFAYVFEGTAKFDSASDNDNEYVESLKLIVFGEGGLVKVKAGESGARFLLVSGAPLNEPIARYGPFVMNTREEIQEAIRDLQAGTFVKTYD